MTTTNVVTAAPGVTKKRPSKKAAAKKAVKKAAKKAAPAREPQDCYCGCGGKTSGGKFLPGHDARFHGRVIKLSDGRLTMDDLKSELGSKGAYALDHYKEGLKHAPKRETHASVLRAKEKATKTPKAKGGSSKPRKPRKAKENTSGATEDTSGGSTRAGSPKERSSTGAGKPTARHKYIALRSIDRAGEMNTIEVGTEVGVGYSLKNMLKQMVADGYLTVETYPKANSDNKESADYFKITDAGRDFYKSMPEHQETAA